MSPTSGPVIATVFFLLMVSWSTMAAGRDRLSDQAYLPLGVWGIWWALASRYGLAVVLNLAALAWVSYRLADDGYPRPLVTVRP